MRTAPNAEPTDGGPESPGAADERGPHGRCGLHLVVVTSAAHRCPTCRAEVEWKDNPFRPFCSERCQLIDLSHWMGERYRVPGPAVGEDNGEDVEE